MGTPKSSILIGFSIINHPFWWYPHLRNPHIYIYIHIHTYTFRHVESTILLWSYFQRPASIRLKDELDTAHEAQVPAADWAGAHG